jgi:carbohydrate diacid regulator
MPELSRAVAQQIVDRIATDVSGAVSIVDTSSYVLASTRLLLGSELGGSARDAVDDDHGSATAREQSDHITLPLVYDGVVLGSIVLHDGGPQQVRLAPLAKALAELIIHQSRLLDQINRQHWLRDRFVFNLLHSRFNASHDEIIQEATALEVDLSLPRLVVVIDIPGKGGSSDNAASSLLSRPNHLLEHARAVISRQAQDIYCWFHPHSLVLLAAIDPSQFAVERDALAIRIQRWLDTVATAGADTPNAGIGRYYAGWPALPQSFADARFALEIGPFIDRTSRVFLPRDLGLASFVCHPNPILKSELAHRLLHPLLDRPDLLATLEAFLETELSAVQTAQRLCIHRHTLDYRLTKIAQLTGLDPRQFHCAAQLQAALLWLHTENTLGALDTPPQVRQPANRDVQLDDVRAGELHLT